ncbi:hypothetical protein TNIN_58301 [Trichonephila inaurata madagascariensis]|uniref:Secreted protein n=1 Tax=Trichonephila inaurata madagascariensis TaxID=2747483 RepID=A0A8X6J3X8_9ARAC|nr:hypothetical protein TNIN_58301 [Trichonephila inaurata madagascariensis]
MQMCLAHALLLHPFLIAVTGPFQLSTLHSPPVTLPPNRSALTSFLSFPASNDPATTLHPPWHPHLHLLPNNSRIERMKGMSDATSTGLCVRGFKWRKFRKGGNASLHCGE